MNAFADRIPSVLDPTGFKILNSDRLDSLNTSFLDAKAAMNSKFNR